MSRQAKSRRKADPSPPQHIPPPAIQGRDEMNLAEFPIGRLGVRDQRETLTYEGWFTDSQGSRYRQKWIVSGSKQYGLPHELGNRMLVALITLAAERQTKEVTFTGYQMLRLLRLSDGQANYKHFERNLLQLAGLTIYSEQAFWDNEQQKHLTTKRAFHIFDDVWLASWRDARDEASDGQGYVVFNDVFWGNIQSGYLKSLDLELYLGTLKSSLARQLYRCLDKFMRYRTVFEIDLFDLAGRVGMQQYRYPSQVKEKLQPALRELSASGFLERATFRKAGPYTRVRFVKAAGAGVPSAADAGADPGAAPAGEGPVHAGAAQPDGAAAARGGMAQPGPGREWLQQRYGVTEAHQALWDAVLQGLRGQLPTATFMSFVEPTLLLSLVDGVATVGARNPKATTWLQARMVRRFQDELNYHLRAAGQPAVTELSVVALGVERE